MVFGATVVRNTGNSPVTLQEAGLIGDVPTSEAHVVDVRVIDPDVHGGDLVGAAQWPYEDFAKLSTPLNDHKLRGGSEVELLFIVEVRNSASSPYWKQTKVDYTSGDVDYVATTQFGFQVCRSQSAECRPPSGD